MKDALIVSRLSQGRDISGKSHGFTLIEMVITIVIIGVLGVGISSFIGQTTKGMMDTAERQKIASIAWIVSEKVSREFRHALPNSIRTSVDLGSGDTCLELIPTIAASDYLSVPILTAANSFEVVPFINYEAADVNTTQDRIAVYPNSITNLYNLPNPGTISGLLNQLNAGVTPGARTVSLALSHQFLGESPTKRFYVVQDPVMYCFSGLFLYRYSQYGFDASLGLQNQTVIGNNVSSGTFDYTAGTLSRNAVVNIAFSIVGSNNESQAINQEVQIRNVP
jgi:MSHA biogenesis protein MshO